MYTYIYIYIYRERDIYMLHIPIIVIDNTCVNISTHIYTLKQHVFRFRRGGDLWAAATCALKSSISFWPDSALPKCDT